MKRFWLLVSQICTVFLAVYFIVHTLKPQWLNPLGWGPKVVPIVQSLPQSSDAIPAGSFRVAAQTASRAVVSISTSSGRGTSAHAKDPWFKFFYGEQDNEPQAGLGSGVIVSSTGYILTNNHVIEGAESIDVALNDGRTARAKVVGSDPDSDLAVLKINLDKLPVIVWGTMDNVQVGDPVLAIGNPFGVGQTVTSGIVSAMGRNQLGINTFENFIQTDAAINPGNSGGALVDTLGNLLGINTAIYSRSGGSMGIGFAIPVTTAKQVLESLVADGEVRRGWIGIEPNELTPEIAETFGIKAQSGVVITGVLQKGPAASAGMVPGDVIVSIAGTPTNNVTQLLTQVAALKPTQVASFVIDRKGTQTTVQVTPGQRPRPKPQQR